MYPTPLCHGVHMIRHRKYIPLIETKSQKKQQQCHAMLVKSINWI